MTTPESPTRPRHDQVDQSLTCTCGRAFPTGSDLDLHLIDSDRTVQAFQWAPATSFHNMERSEQLWELFVKSSKRDLSVMVMDLLAEATGHADDTDAHELRADFIVRHETLAAAGLITRRLPSHLRQA